MTTQLFHPLIGIIIDLFILSGTIFLGHVILGKFGFQKKSFKKYERFKKIVVVGMGGSILGTKAIYCFLQHKIKINVQDSNVVEVEGGEGGKTVIINGKIVDSSTEKSESDERPRHLSRQVNKIEHGV